MRYRGRPADFLRRAEFRERINDDGVRRDGFDSEFKGFRGIPRCFERNERVLLSRERGHTVSDVAFNGRGIHAHACIDTHCACLIFALAPPTHRPYKELNKAIRDNGCIHWFQVGKSCTEVPFAVKKTFI